jgi:hypothetical protein
LIRGLLATGKSDEQSKRHKVVTKAWG